MANNFDEYEKQFRELDKKEYSFLAKKLEIFREAMMDVGFTRGEAFQLVAAHQKYLYDMSLEEFREKLLFEFEMIDEDDED